MGSIPFCRNHLKLQNLCFFFKSGKNTMIVRSLYLENFLQIALPLGKKRSSGISEIEWPTAILPQSNFELIWSREKPITSLNLPGREHEAQISQLTSKLGIAKFPPTEISLRSAEVLIRTCRCPARLLQRHLSFFQRSRCRTFLDLYRPMHHHGIYCFRNSQDFM